jgi:hypothetical protein
MRRSLAATFAISVLALGLAACGGGGEDDKLSKTEIGKQANAICQEFDKKIAAVPQPTGARNPGTAAAYADQTRPIVRQAIAKLDELEPEESIEKDWTIFIGTQKEAANLLDDLVEQIKERDAGAQDTLGKINAAAESGNVAAKRLGASSCASTASTTSPNRGSR